MARYIYTICSKQTLQMQKVSMAKFWLNQMECLKY